jgi:methylated-DNA-protein-cysteine methyltransferase related protein
VGRKSVKSDLYPRIYETVKRIPYGRVTTYGQIALLVGAPGAARVVGYALHALREGTDVPWQRVINREGRLSLRKLGEAGELQRKLLEQEGVTFDAKETIDWEQFGWWGSPD